MILPEGQRRHCCVCKDWIIPGQEYTVLPHARNCSRHIDCVPKNPNGPKRAKEKGRPPTGSPKRRRAGGHGYYGGDGWVNL